MQRDSVRPVIRQRRLAERAEAVPRVWWAGNPVMTAFFNALSVLLPLGEAFFIRSMKPFMGRICEPSLAEDVRVFISQETEHAREHAYFNRVMHEHGYDTRQIGKPFEALLRLGVENQPPLPLLANTVASEHITAILAELIMRDDRWLEGAADEHRQMWLWHAAEEIEHKAVAFDLYAHVGGGYGLRALALIQTALVFPVVIAMMMIRFLYHDGLLTSGKTWRELAGFSRLVLGSMGRVMRRCADFMRLSFHPNDHDDELTLRAWRLRLDGFCR